MARSSDPNQRSQNTESGGTPRGKLNTPDDLNIAEFFTRDDGRDTIVRNADLEAAVPNNEKGNLVEIDRYWVRKPFSFVTIFETKTENERQYYVIEPQLTSKERGLISFLKDKIRTSLEYSDVRTKATKEERVITLREKSLELLRNYNLINNDELTDVETQTNEDDETRTLPELFNYAIDYVYNTTQDDGSDEKIPYTSRESITQTLDRKQVEKILYYVIRDFIRYDRIDPIMEDPNVEDISIEGWGGTVFVVHSRHEQMTTNVTFGKEDLDEFVTALAQKANKGISKRQPSVDATLEDGSRAILMLGDEITEKGSTFTIRDFNEIPFTPIDLINWGTYSMDQIVYLWLAVENGKSGIIAGGTASGKTTTLNAISLFIPATEKIVSIEDTRELQVPQKMWVPLNTRESFSDNEDDNIDEIDLLWNSLRMSPEYVIYGEVRGKEARSLFQNLNTGHTAYSTFHGNNAKEVRVRLTTDPINVDDTSFAGLDMIITQEQVAIDGKKVRRAKNITELEEYITEYNEFSTSNPFTWDQSTDEFTGDLSTANIESNSPLMEEIRNENGWSKERLQKEIKQRKVVLAYLIDNGIKEYTDVAATIQGYMYSKESVLAKIAEGSLSSETESFQEIKNIDIDVNTDLESGVPRPQANSKTKSKARNILEENKDLYQDITATNDPNAGDIKQLDGKKGPSTEQETSSEGVWSND